MINKPEQRVAIFIDTQNMYHSAKHLFNAKVNFSTLVEYAAAGRNVIRAVAYVAKSKTGEEQAFFDALTQHGIELKIKDVQEFASGQKKADWDVGMTVDAISMSPRVDVVILVTGDGDFVPLVEYLKTHGVLAEVVAFAESTNARLREIANQFVDVSSHADDFLIRPRYGEPKEKHEGLDQEAAEEQKALGGGRRLSRSLSGRGRRESLSSGASSQKIKITY